MCLLQPIKANYECCGKDDTGPCPHVRGHKNPTTILHPFVYATKFKHHASMC